MIRNWIKSFWTVFQMDISRKSMFKVLTVKLLLFKICKYVWTCVNWWSDLWSCSSNFLFKNNGEGAKRYSHSRQMIEVVASSNTYSKMGKHYDKRKQRYVDISRDRSKITCTIHINDYYSKHFKVLNDFGTRYATRIYFK